MSNAALLRGAVNKDQADNASKLRGAVGVSTPLSDFKEGVATPIRKMATMFSGDPEMRGLPPVPEAPNSLAGRIGQIATESVLIGLPVGKLASGVVRGAEGATGIANTLRNVISDVGAGFAKSPTRFLAGEAALGATSGAGGYAAEQMFPDSDAARFVGEILGGVAPSAAATTGKGLAKGTLNVVDWATDKNPLSATIKGKIKNTWDEVARTVNAGTAGSRARQRFERATDGASPQDISSAMAEDIMPEARAIMTPAQLSRNPGLLSLERSVINESDTLRNKSEEQLVALNNVIRQGLTGSVSEEAARSGLESSQRDYYALLNERVRIAALKADEDIQRMIPGLGAEQANKVAARELGKALDDAAKQERELFSKIDMKAPAPTGNVRSELGRLVTEAGKAGKGSIPDYAIDLFTPGGRNFLGATTSVNELRQAQSQLRNIARNNRVGTDPDFNRARIADILGDAITEDLAMAQGDNPQLIKDAVAFSRAKNQTFRQGVVGKILRTGSDNSDMIPDALTLEATLGLTGPKGAQAYDDLMEAATFRNGPTVVLSEVGNAMDSYVKSEFLRSAVKGDKINVTSAETFLRNNESFLNRFPQIRKDIEQAIASGSGLKAAEDLRKGGISTFSDPNVSKAAIFINKGPVAAFNDVLKSRNAGLEVRKLKDLAAADASGEAAQGLKTGFMDYIMDTATDGEFISGAKLSELATSKKGKQIINELFDGAERARFYQIVRTAERADAARNARQSIEGVTGDTLSRVTNTVLGVLGAAYGRQVSTGMGGGTVQIPGMMADNFRKLGISGLVNPAKRLIVDAMQDEKLFRQVLMAEDPEHLSPQATRLFNAWAAGALAREVSQDEDEQ